jgi:hypothetical protein
LISVGIANNVITFISNAIHESNIDKTESNKIIKGIKVDKFGRVTEVIQSALTNSEIPETLSNKILENSKTSSDEIGTDSRSIVNKKYVDEKIAGVHQIATGALHFEGIVNNSTDALKNLTVNNNGAYYKVTSDFSLDKSYFEGISTGEINIGDTLIVYNISNVEAKYIHIPSGDDVTALPLTVNRIVNNLND